MYPTQTFRILERNCETDLHITFRGKGIKLSPPFPFLSKKQKLPRCETTKGGFLSATTRHQRWAPAHPNDDSGGGTSDNLNQKVIQPPAMKWPFQANWNFSPRGVNEDVFL